MEHWNNGQSEQWHYSTRLAQIPSFTSDGCYHLLTGSVIILISVQLLISCPLEAQLSLSLSLSLINYLCCICITELLLAIADRYRSASLDIYYHHYDNGSSSIIIIAVTFLNNGSRWNGIIVSFQVSVMWFDFTPADDELSEGCKQYHKWSLLAVKWPHQPISIVSGSCLGGGSGVGDMHKTVGITTGISSC